MSSERCGNMRDGGGSGEGSQQASASLEKPDEALPPTARNLESDFEATEEVTIDFVHNGFSSVFELKLTLKDTLGFVETKHIHKGGAISGITDPNGNWFPSDYPQEEGWEYDGILFFRKDDVTRHNYASTPAIFSPPKDLSCCLPKDAPLSELNISNGDFLIVFLVLTKDNKDWSHYYRPEDYPVTPPREEEAEKVVPEAAAPDTISDTITISVYHNGKWDKFGVAKTRTDWTLDYLINTVLPQCPGVDSFELDGRELHGYNGWEYDGYQIFHGRDIYFKNFDDDDVPVRFIPGSDSEALPKDIPISELNIKDGDYLFIYFCLSKDGKEWVQHYPLDVCPLTVARKFEIVDQLVDKWMKSSKIFRDEFNQDAIDDEIKKQKRKKQQTRESQRKRMDELLEQKRTIETAARTMAMLWEDQEAVHGLLKFEEDGLWYGIVWTSKENLEEMELDSGFVEKVLLSKQALKHKDFHGSHFIDLKHFDRQQAVDEAKYRQVHKDSQNSYTLTAIGGQLVTYISLTWLKRHMPKEVLTELEETPVGGRVKICYGSSSRSGSGFISTVASKSADAPRIQYRNEAEQCTLKSMASALHFLGYPKVAWIISQGYKVGYESCDFNKAMTFIDETTRKYYGKKMRLRGMLRKSRFYCPLNLSYRPPHPILASLKAVDAMKRPTQINHCLCFVGDYIFDSNMETTLPISTESLDAICDSIVTGATYAGIFQSRELLIKK